MKTVSAPLLAHLQAGGPFVMADLYTITMASGTLLRWTSYDVDVVHPVSGLTYSSSGPVISRGKTRTIIGAEVDTLDVSIFPRTTDLINGVGILAAAQAGGFDGAMLNLERAFLSPAPTAVGVVSMFYGRFADLKIGRTSLVCRINSGTEALATLLPRNRYQPGCIHTVYDSGCGLSRSSFGSSSTVLASSTNILLNCGLSNAASYFDRGYVQFVGGALDGVRRTVKSYTPGAITLFSPLPSVPVVSAVFSAYAGCDKTQATCTSKFSNVAQFRGAPYIPIPVIAA